MNQRRTLPLRSLAAVFGLLAGIAACSSNPQERAAVTGPSAIPNSLAVGPGTPTVRFYKATISPTSASAGTVQSFTITTTNCSAGTCDAGHATTSSQTMKSVAITVPGTFNVHTGSFAVTASGGKVWTASLVSGVIKLVKTGNDQLDPGESVTVTFSADVPCANGPYEWTTVGYNDTTFSTAYTLFGSQPTVTVTGTCANHPCTLGQGYWEHHYPSKWPPSVISGGMNLGSVHYTAAQIESILQQNPIVGNGLLSLAHQLIAAKLNVANGANASTISATITHADSLIGSLVVPPIGSDTLPTSTTSSDNDALDTWNNGCPDQD
jgi:hypothetical protein